MIITLKLNGQKIVCMIEDGSKVNTLELPFIAVLKSVNGDNMLDQQWAFNSIEIDATSEIKEVK